MGLVFFSAGHCSGAFALLFFSNHVTVIFQEFFALLFLLLMSLSLMIFTGVFESPDYFMYLLFHVFHPPKK